MKEIFEKADEVRRSPVFQKSNKVWNNARLNATKNIGNLMFLIKKMQPKSLEEWNNRYIASGKYFERETGFSFPEKKIRARKDVQWDPREYGRSPYYLKRVATKFQQEMVHNKMYIDFETAYEYVCIRVVYETWLGYQRELDALKELRETFPKYTFRETEPSVDTKMAVDFEMVDANGNIVCGIQVKGPHVYKSIIKENHERNRQYEEEHGVPVVYLIVEDHKISNIHELKKLLRR